MRLKQSEREALKMLWRCGVIRRTDLAQHFELQGNRLRQFESELLVKIADHVVYLGDVGKRYCEDYLKMTNIYRTSFRQLEHDLLLANGYLSLPKEAWDTWKTEYDLYHEFKNDPRFVDLKREIEESGQQFVAVPDAAVWNENAGGYVAFEAITRHYAKKSIDQKRQFAALFLKGIITFGTEEKRA